MPSPTTFTDVDLVATEADLEDEIGGTTALANIRPPDWTDCERARQRAFDRVIAALARRTPPIREGDLARMAELRDAVIYGALAILYSQAMTTGDEDALFTSKRDYYDKRFADEIAGLTPTLAGDLRGATQSFAVERR